MIPRRSIFVAFSGLALGRSVELAAKAPSLATAQIEITGDWRASLPGSAAKVVEAMRGVCLAGVPLLSDRQPARIRVDSRTSGSPAIWLHFDDSPVAWILVNIGERDWSKLAYQFGHELGHVLANSWGPDAKPAPPCQWLEEALVEAFSLRGLGLLAKSWAVDPPFAGDQAFAAAIRQYRENLVSRYSALESSRELAKDRRAWFAKYRSELERRSGAEMALVPALLTELEKSTDSVADLGALNRWKGRSTLALEEYLQAWSASCREIGASGRTARLLRDWLLG